MPTLGKYLQPLGFGNLGTFRDPAHASRLYLDDFYALSPKNSWIYYVEFDINPAAVLDETWLNQQRITEVGMLVKSCALPKFNIKTETISQYNRKTVVQTGIDYQPIDMTFHDDMSNVVNNLWINYYRYYYSDSVQGETGPVGTDQEKTTGAFSNNKYNPGTDLFNPVNYGLNSDRVVEPFFRSITLYQMNRKMFTSYKLINPLITSWEHDRLDQTDGSKVAENKMTVSYESVFYSVGQIKKDNPTGFAMFHYDTSPSPLSIAGGGNNSILGPGGIVDGAFDIFGDVTGLTGPNSKPSPLDLLGVAIKGGNLASNLTKVSKESLRSEGYSTLYRAFERGGRGASLSNLGVNLNLNLRNNPVGGKEIISSPVAIAGGIGLSLASAVSRSTTRPTVPTNIKDIAQSELNNTRNLSATLNNLSFTAPTIDNSVTGNTVSSGKYFTTPQPIESLGTANFSNITSNSSIEDITLSIETIKSFWSEDLSKINAQSINPTEIEAKLKSAVTDKEYNAIKNEAALVVNSVESMKTVINNKYEPEYTRLSNLLTSAINNPNKKGNVI